MLIASKYRIFVSSIYMGLDVFREFYDYMEWFFTIWISL